MSQEVSRGERFRGAFYGFATGDAFGYPARSMTYEQLCERFEARGCLELAVSRQTGNALFSDATQLMLFTNEGVLWADAVSAKGQEVNYSLYVFYAYQLWLYTQTKTVAGEEYAWLFDKERNPYKCKLLKNKALYKNRYIDKTNIAALLSAKKLNYGKLINHINDNTDNGGLKRVLPAGLYFNYDTELAFRIGADFAAITHTAPTGYLPAGVYSAIIAELVNGADLDNAVNTAMRILKGYDGFEETFATLDKMLKLYANEEIAPLEAVEQLGNSRRADNALAISLFAALLHCDNMKNAIRLAVNQDGDSDVCGALCGSILGTLYGDTFIPKKWLRLIQQAETLEESAIRLKKVTAFNEEEDSDDE